jgi:hypothetical protein
MDYELTRKVLAALEREGVQYVVFGAEDLLGEYPAIQYVPPSGRFHIDVLTRLGELFDYASLASERVDFDGISVPTVTPEMLYRMKKGTVRPKDWGDAQRIALRFGLKE